MPTLLPASKRWIVWFCFFFSGLSGLLYEVIWVRQFEVVFGASTYAVGAVLTAFMGGLGLGSWAASQKADGSKNPLRAYGWLETVIGLYAWVFPFLFHLAYQLYIPLEIHFALTPFASLMIRFIAAVLLLLIPTACMGATLPFLSKVIVRDEQQGGWDVGKLYGVNTVGAVLGVLLAGFALIPLLGELKTTWGAACLNLILGAAALFLSRDLFAKSKPELKPRFVPKSKRSPWVTLAIFLTALSGFSAMVYETCYNRILAMTLGGSVYAFSTMLATFLVGISLGALVVSSCGILFKKNLETKLAGVLAGAGLTALGTGFLFDRLGYFFFWLTELLGHFGWDVGQSQRTIQFFVSAAVMMPTALFLGGAFPLILKLGTVSLKEGGRWVGRVYSWNTLGAILGSFTAAFLLVPFVGLQTALTLGALLHLAGALIVVLFRIKISSFFRLSFFAAGLLGLFILLSFLPSWNRHRMAIGPYVQVSFLSETAPIHPAIDGRVDMTNLLFYREGVATTVTVEKNLARNTLFLSNNGKPEASTYGDLPTQQLIAELPLFWFESTRLRPARQGLLIGLASGISAGAALQHSLDQLTVVDIEPFMPQAAALFQDYNFAVLADPKFKFVSDDGRHYLKTHPRQFDVIISEPSNPWLSGVSNLFTRESFETAQDSLTPDGVFCQWVQIYEMKLEDVKTIVRTFHSVFPNTYVFATPPKKGEKTPGADLILLGSSRPLNPRLSALDQVVREPKIQAAIKRIGLEQSGDLLSLLRLGPSDVSSFEGKGPLNLDDNALIEFSAPLSFYRNTYYEDLMEVRKYQTDPTQWVSTQNHAELKKLLLRISSDLYPYWRRDLAVEYRDRANHL